MHDMQRYGIDDVLRSEMSLGISPSETLGKTRFDYQKIPDGLEYTKPLS
jgi:hypothetical protein